MKNNEATEVINRAGGRIPMNLQFFAEKGGADDGGNQGGDDQDGGDDGDDSGDDDADPGADNSGDNEKKFTQADINAAVEKRLAKERKKMPTKEELAAFREYQKQQKGNQGGDDKNEELTKAQEENSKLATKVMCLERGVLKENIDDVVALAMSYVDDDTDIEDAIEKVLKKYPTFTKKQNQEDDNQDDGGKNGSKSWGQRQDGKGAPKLSGVEAAFYAKNPGLRPKN